MKDMSYFSCPKYEDLSENVREIGKSENITEDTVLFPFLVSEFESQVYC